MSQGLNTVANTETQRDRRLRLRAEERARRMLGEGNTIYTQKQQFEASVDYNAPIKPVAPIVFGNQPNQQMYAESIPAQPFQNNIQEPLWQQPSPQYQNQFASDFINQPQNDERLKKQQYAQQLNSQAQERSNQDSNQYESASLQIGQNNQQRINKQQYAAELQAQIQERQNSVQNRQNTVDNYAFVPQDDYQVRQRMQKQYAEQLNQQIQERSNLENSSYESASLQIGQNNQQRTDKQLYAAELQAQIQDRQKSMQNQNTGENYGFMPQDDYQARQRIQKQQYAAELKQQMQQKQQLQQSPQKANRNILLDYQDKPAVPQQQEDQMRKKQYAMELQQQINQRQNSRPRGQEQQNNDYPFPEQRDNRDKVNQYRQELQRQMEEQKRRKEEEKQREMQLQMQEEMKFKKELQEEIESTKGKPGKANQPVSQNPAYVEPIQQEPWQPQPIIQENFPQMNPPNMSYMPPTQMNQGFNPQLANALQEYQAVLNSIKNEQYQGREQILAMKEQMLKERENQLQEMMQALRMNSNPMNQMYPPMFPNQMMPGFMPPPMYQQQFYQQPYMMPWNSQQQSKPFNPPDLEERKRSLFGQDDQTIQPSVQLNNVEPSVVLPSFEDDRPAILQKSNYEDDRHIPILAQKSSYEDDRPIPTLAQKSSYEDDRPIPTLVKQPSYEDDRPIPTLVQKPSYDIPENNGLALLDAQLPTIQPSKQLNRLHTPDIFEQSLNSTSKWVEPEAMKWGSQQFIESLNKKQVETNLDDSGEWDQSLPSDIQHLAFPMPKKDIFDEPIQEEDQSEEDDSIFRETQANEAQLKGLLSDRSKGKLKKAKLDFPEFPQEEIKPIYSSKPPSQRSNKKKIFDKPQTNDIFTNKFEQRGRRKWNDQQEQVQQVIDQICNERRTQSREIPRESDDSLLQDSLEFVKPPSAFNRRSRPQSKDRLSSAGKSTFRDVTPGSLQKLNNSVQNCERPQSNYSHKDILDDFIEQYSSQSRPISRNP